jgi:hypothetical protein
MRCARTRAGQTHSAEPTATHREPYSKRHKRTPEPPDRTLPPPRITQLLVLAYGIDGMIRAGQIQDWAEAARLLGVTRARMTQIGNLLLLAPCVQEAILLSSNQPPSQSRWTERSLRDVIAHPGWGNQCAFSCGDRTSPPAIRWRRRCGAMIPVPTPLPVMGRFDVTRLRNLGSGR